MAFHRVQCLCGTFRVKEISTKLFHNGCAQSSFKQSKMLNKLLTKGDRKKMNITPVDHSSPFVAVTKNEGKRKFNPSKMRRAEQVSKVLFSYISDLIQYGDEDFSKIEATIEISKVNMSPDFSALVVHWIATGTSKDVIIQQMLEKNSSKIRQHLINLRFVGTLPPITFVPDLSEVQYQIVVDLLKTADMGPEENQLTGEDLQKQQPRILSRCVSGLLEKQINENMKENSLSDVNTKKNYKDLKLASEKTEQNLPEADSNLEVVNKFENDVYLLDHTHLMQLVKDKQPSSRKLNESLSLSNQEFVEQYSKIVAKRKEGPRKLKEYTYLEYLREEENKVNDD